MNTNQDYGWLLFRAAKEEFKPENTLEKYLKTDQERERDGIPINDCLYRDGAFHIYCQRHKTQLTINTTGEEKGNYEISEGGNLRRGKFVSLSDEPEPPYEHFFRLASVSDDKTLFENLRWRVAIKHVRVVAADDSLTSEDAPLP